MQITAAVVDQAGGDFTPQEVSLGEPAGDEVLVEVVGAGLCHTDIAVKEGHLPFPFPGVLGHEASGVVVEVGSSVTKVGKGDKVAVSFNSCGACVQCKKDAPAYCEQFMAANFGGQRFDGSSALSRGQEQIGSNFFGQSSLATHAIAHERNVVKVPDSAPLELVGPLGCGVQTGAGAVMNSLDCEPGSSVLVLGGGSVGLSAVLGAAARGLRTIIVAEPMGQRRELARELGATHVIDPAEGALSEMVRAVAPEGVEYAVDTTAQVPVIEQAVLSLGQRGAIGLLGVPADPAAALPLSLIQTQVTGTRVVGIVEGDSDPDTFIPLLLELHAAGRFPFDKLITKKPFSAINEAVAAQHEGEAIKIVLVHD